MTTLMQQRAIENTVQNGGNVTQAMRDAGYAEATVHNPINLTKSKGYMERLAELGLTEELVTSALVEDIREKKGKRTPELALAAELLGMRKMGVAIATQVVIQQEEARHAEERIDTSDPRIIALAERYERELAMLEDSMMV